MYLIHFLTNIYLIVFLDNQNMFLHILATFYLIAHNTKYKHIIPTTHRFTFS